MERVNVAIADDNERILDLLEEIINMDEELHVVGKAKNGEEMCQIIRNKQPDVVLLDLIMPKMDGLTVMEKINQDQTVNKHPDFIVVTAVGQEQITEDAFHRGASYYISAGFHHHGGSGHGCVECDYKSAVSDSCQAVSDNIQPCGACHPSCYRSGLEQGKAGYTGRTVWLYSQYRERETDEFGICGVDRRHDPVGIQTQIKQLETFAIF